MATKTLVNSLLKAIRRGDEADVRRLVDADPELVHAKCSAPPKKDDGQSPLQVALKTGRFAIADYLIDRGANVNYIEESSINEWRAPVLHDAIRAAACNMPVGSMGDLRSFSAAIALIKRMLNQGADPNAVDSYGNNCLMRTLLDLRIRLTSLPVPDMSDAPSHPVFDEHAKILLGALMDAGADIYASTVTRESAYDDARGRYFERFFARRAG